MMIHLDADDASSDWIKRGAWDLTGIDSVESLRALLAQQGQTVADFKRTVVYRENLRKLPWLRDL